MSYGSKCISDWQYEVHQTAKEKGWWDEPTPEQLEVNRKLARITLDHMVLSDHLEALRRGEQNLIIRDIDVLMSKLDSKQIDILAKIALIHSEISEAAEATIDRAYKQTGGTWTKKDGDPNNSHEISKPEGVVVEFADAVIRIMNACGGYSWSLYTAIRDKVDYNRTRPHRHGGKLA
jgi:hypothetical protein